MSVLDISGCKGATARGRQGGGCKGTTTMKKGGSTASDEEGLRQGGGYKGATTMKKGGSTASDDEWRLQGGGCKGAMTARRRLQGGDDSKEATTRGRRQGGCKGGNNETVEEDGERWPRRMRSKRMSERGENRGMQCFFVYPSKIGRIKFGRKNG